jgi:NADPH:quinone reductase
MRAAVLRGGGEADVVCVAAPEPGPGEVRVRLEGCGVCGSDLPLWQGRPWFDYPRPPGASGHEGWGWVDTVGPGVAGLERGMRVTGLMYHAYAERDLAAAEHLVGLPPKLDGEPVPGEALGCAVNVVRRSGIEAGQSVAVVGVGFLGALVTQLAARAGARVLGIARSPWGRHVAITMGADEALRADAEAVGRVHELTGGELCDVVVEAAGAQATLDLAGAIVRVRGRLVIAGFHQDGPRQVDLQSWNWRGLDVVNAHERDPAVYVEGIRRAVGALADGTLDPSPLYTHRMALDDVGHALRLAAERAPGFSKALVLT